MRINNKDIIYLDNNATTCTDTAVVEAMLPYFSEMYGNAMASTYIMGWQAEEAVSEATTQLAQLINAHPFEIIYTSGATESNNLAIKGFPFSENDRLIVSNIEHKCVLEAAKYMGEGNGLHLSILKCDSSGKIPVDTVHKALSENTMFVSLMLANNEIHSINPIKQIAKLCKEREILFHVDAAQAIGKIPVDVKEMDVDMLSLSAHKFYGPKGIGALYIKNGINHIKLKPLLHGGKQEKGLRSGTLAVPLIVGLGKAARIAKNKLTEKTAINKIKELTEKMYHGIKMEINDIILNGTALEERLPGGLNITFPNIDVGKLQFEIPHICFSRGSACSSGSLDYSYVLKAIGITPQQAVGTARFCIGRYNTETEIDEAVYEIVNAVKKLYTKKDYMYFLN